MDTKPLELEAESLIQHELIKHGFNVTKPTFDKEGADLIIIDELKSKFTKSLRIQCKGRNLNGKSARVEIPVSYVDENFIVFIYLKPKSIDSELYVFFCDEIVRWKASKNSYSINFSQAKIDSGELSAFRFSAERATKINTRLKKAPINKYTTVLIDEAYLNEAISRTIEEYEEIYPERQFDRPTRNEAIKHILEMYDNFKTNDMSINCHVYSYDEVVPEQTSMHTIRIATGASVKIFQEIIDQFVNFEILDHLKRIINSENIILVTNDVLFDSVLESFIEKGVSVTMVLYSSDQGRNIYAKNKWGDIMYPLAKSIGLQEYEW